MLLHAVCAAEVHSRLAALQTKQHNRQRRPVMSAKDPDSARLSSSDIPQPLGGSEGIASADATGQSGRQESRHDNQTHMSGNSHQSEQPELGRPRSKETGGKSCEQGSMERSQSTAEMSDQEHESGRHIGGQQLQAKAMEDIGTVHSAANCRSPAHGQAGDETFWTDMAEEYCGTEEGHLEAALHAETGDGQEIGLYPQGSAEVSNQRMLTFNSAIGASGWHAWPFYSPAININLRGSFVYAPHAMAGQLVSLYGAS